MGVHQLEFCKISRADIRFLASALSISLIQINDKRAKIERTIKTKISFLLVENIFKSPFSIFHLYYTIFFYYIKVNFSFSQIHYRKRKLRFGKIIEFFF